MDSMYCDKSFYLGSTAPSQAISNTPSNIVRDSERLQKSKMLPRNTPEIIISEFEPVSHGSENRNLQQNQVGYVNCPIHIVNTNDLPEVMNSVAEQKDSGSSIQQNTESQMSSVHECSESPMISISQSNIAQLELNSQIEDALLVAHILSNSPEDVSL